MNGARETEDEVEVPPLLPRLILPLKARWWWMPACAVLLMLVVLVYVLRAQPIWTAEMRVYPAPASEGLAPRQSGLAGLAGLSASFGIGLGKSAGAPPFRYFLDGLATPDVAARLAADESILRTIYDYEWDDEAAAWRAPGKGLVGGTRDFFFGVFGLPVSAWTPPDPARLRAYIEDRVEVVTSVRSPLVTISHSHHDPAFAARFLDAVVAAADAEVRRADALRSAANIDYLSRQLGETAEADTRLALVEALAAEERSAMLTAAATPYAAEVFSPAVTGRLPSRPRPLPLFIAALFAGVLIGAALALWRGFRSVE
jgi:uncharacterized protein involved in exopolysaccharide biosynthesis